MGGVVSKNLTTGRSLATKYGRIDTIREDFDVDANEVLERAITSVNPMRESMLHIQYDLYGPLMSVLTLGCFIVLGMQSHANALGTSADKGSTVLGAALGLCFTYWAVAVGFFYTVCKLCDTALELLPIVALVGYGFVGLVLAFAIGLISVRTHGRSYDSKSSTAMLVMTLPDVKVVAGTHAFSPQGCV
eukprot:SAG22_NODE_420_length_10739_cov_7.090320_2_plen_189_part_00